jgi:hypothetical protein
VTGPIILLPFINNARGCNDFRAILWSADNIRYIFHSFTAKYKFWGPLSVRSFWQCWMFNCFGAEELLFCRVASYPLDSYLPLTTSTFKDWTGIHYIALGGNCISTRFIIYTSLLVVFRHLQCIMPFSPL